VKFIRLLTSIALVILAALANASVSSGSEMLTDTVAPSSYRTPIRQALHSVTPTLTYSSILASPSLAATRSTSASSETKSEPVDLVEVGSLFFLLGLLLRRRANRPFENAQQPSSFQTRKVEEEKVASRPSPNVYVEGGVHL
jgi:hypothetical protein